MPEIKRKSLAELQADPNVGLPETTYQLCVAGKLNLERERIETELSEAMDEPKVTRVGSKSRTKKLNDDHEKLIAQMSEYLVDIRFRPKAPHEWRTWKAEHPPREGDEVDEQLGYNVDALSDSLREFIVSVNDEPVTDDWWKVITEAAAPGDEWRMTQRVIGAHAGSVEIPKSWTAFIKSRESSDD